MRPQHRDSARTRRAARARRTPLAALSALGAALLVAAGALTGVVGVTAPAAAAGQVSVSGTPSLDGESQLSLSGSGFQSVQGGFGGIYVLFGWVDDAGGGWKPSNGGKTGDNYRYVYDDESKPAGFQLFVTFPGSSTAAAANGGELAADGTWSGTIRVPGARFTTYDRSQNETTVDCTEVQCGIITIGAHGVVNAGNETFTPVDFPDAGGGDSGDGAAADESGDDTAAEAEDGSADTPAAAAGDSGDAAGGQDAAAPVTAGTAIDPQLVADQQRQQTLLTVLVAVGIVLALCVMALSFGIGGYLAMKALLLGVNPEALEKVRRKREERAVKAEHKRRRRVSDLRRREEIRSQRAEARNDGRADRATLEHGGAPGTEQASAHGTITDPWVSIQENSDVASAASTGTGSRRSEAAQPWGGPALLQFFDDDTASSTARTQNASTIVLDRVNGTPDAEGTSEGDAR